MSRGTHRLAVALAVVLLGSSPAMAGPVLKDDPLAYERAQIARLLMTIQDQVELDARLGGTLVLDAFFVPRDDGTFDLRLRGKFIHEEQPELLADVFSAVIAADPYWRGRRDEVFIDLQGMPLVTPSPVLAARFYGIGQEHFWRGDFKTADRAFARAIAESPAVEAYRYWSVLTALALNQDARAFHKLRPLLRADPYGSLSFSMAHELERIQGPLRWRLYELEKRVLLHEVPGEVPFVPPPPPVPVEEIPTIPVKMTTAK